MTVALVVSATVAPLTATEPPPPIETAPAPELTVKPPLPSERSVLVVVGVASLSIAVVPVELKVRELAACAVAFRWMV